MKKHLFALAVAALSGAACAQSSVTIYGIVDLGVTHSTARGPGGTHATQVTSGNLSSSRVGFRGVEELGRGLSAAFVLEAHALADDGRAARHRVEAPRAEAGRGIRVRPLEASRALSAAHVRNRGGARATVGASTFGQGVSNENPSGVDLGIRHSF